MSDVLAVDAVDVTKRYGALTALDGVVHVTGPAGRRERSASRSLRGH